MLYIIRSDYFMCSYILEPLKARDDIRMIVFERDHLPFISKIKRFLRAFIIRKKGLWTHLFYNDRIIREISQIKPEDKVLFFAVENLKELLILDKEVPAQERSVYIWNPVVTINRNIFSKIEYFIFMNLLKMNIFTFDQNDAKRYWFKYAKQVYKYPLLNSYQTKVIPNSVFFIGKDKHRNKELAKMASLLKSISAQPNFYILKEKRTEEEPILKDFYHNEGMAYYQVLACIRESACLLEILQKGQSGITLRTLEAMFWHKKLITTNEEIRNFDFYNPCNIFIYTQETKAEDLKDFIQTPFVPIQKSITDDYEINKWIEQFV